MQCTYMATEAWAEVSNLSVSPPVHKNTFSLISDFLPAVSVPFDTFCGQCTIHEGVLTRFEDRSKRSSRFCRLLDRLRPDFILKSGRIEIHPNTVPLENSVECIDRRNAKTANLPVH